jgi:hypothetical protein
MWSQEGREAFALFMAFAESKLIEVREVVEEFISAYRPYIIVGLLILISLVILDLVAKRQERREKKQIEAEIEKQMQEKMIHDDRDESP